VNPIVKDQLQKKIELSKWITIGVILVPSLFFAPVKFSLGVLLGGFISILNFYWMEKGLRGFFQKTGGNVKGPVLIKYYIRLAMTAVVLYFLIAYETVNVIGLLIGLSVVVINIVITVIFSLTKKNLIEEVI
jgi:chromate transport protein ChrA